MADKRIFLLLFLVLLKIETLYANASTLNSKMLSSQGLPDVIPFYNPLLPASSNLLPNSENFRSPLGTSNPLNSNKGTNEQFKIPSSIIIPDQANLQMSHFPESIHNRNANFQTYQRNYFLQDRKFPSGTQNMVSSRPASLAFAGDDSASSQAQIKTNLGVANAEAFSSGSFRGRGSQIQVQGSHSGNGSFSAQAHSGFTGGYLQSQVNGGRGGSLSESSAKVEHVGLAHSQIQTGQLNAGDNSGNALGHFSSGLLQLQARSNKNGASVEAQSHSSGLSSSQAQVNFGEPTGSRVDQFQNSFLASVHGSLSSGHSRMQLQGMHATGKLYNASSLGSFDSNFNSRTRLTPSTSGFNLQINNLSSVYPSLPVTHLESFKRTPDQLGSFISAQEQPSTNIFRSVNSDIHHNAYPSRFPIVSDSKSHSGTRLTPSISGFNFPKNNVSSVYKDSRDHTRQKEIIPSSFPINPLDTFKLYQDQVASHQQPSHTFRPPLTDAHNAYSARFPYSSGSNLGMGLRPSASDLNLQANNFSSVYSENIQPLRGQGFIPSSSVYREKSYSSLPLNPLDSFKPPHDQSSSFIPTFHQLPNNQNIHNAYPYRTPQNVYTPLIYPSSESNLPHSSLNKQSNMLYRPEMISPPVRQDLTLPEESKLFAMRNQFPINKDRVSLNPYLPSIEQHLARYPLTFPQPDISSQMSQPKSQANNRQINVPHNLNFRWPLNHQSSIRVPQTFINSYVSKEQSPPEIKKDDQQRLIPDYISMSSLKPLNYFTIPNISLTNFQDFPSQEIHSNPQLPNFLLTRNFNDKIAGIDTKHSETVNEETPQTSFTPKAGYFPRNIDLQPDSIKESRYFPSVRQSNVVVTESSHAFTPSEAHLPSIPTEDGFSKISPDTISEIGFPVAAEPRLSNETNCCEAVGNLRSRCCGHSVEAKESSPSCCSSMLKVNTQDSTSDPTFEQSSKATSCKIVRTICYIINKPNGRARICRPTSTRSC